MGPSREVVALLQACVTPMVLISGVGILVLSLTNRLARTNDRIQDILRSLGRAGEPYKVERLSELRILLRRNTYLRLSMVSITLSILCSSLIIFALLAAELLKWDMHHLALLFLVLSVLGIALCAIFLLMDILLATHWLREQIRTYLGVYERAG